MAKAALGACPAVHRPPRGSSPWDWRRGEWKSAEGGGGAVRERGVPKWAERAWVQQSG